MEKLSEDDKNSSSSEDAALEELSPGRDTGVASLVVDEDERIVSELLLQGWGTGGLLGMSETEASSAELDEEQEEEEEGGDI